MRITKGLCPENCYIASFTAPVKIDYPFYFTLFIHRGSGYYLLKCKSVIAQNITSIYQHANRNTQFSSNTFLFGLEVLGLDCKNNTINVILFKFVKLKRKIQ